MNSLISRLSQHFELYIARKQCIPTYIKCKLSNKKNKMHYTEDTDST